VPLPTPLPLVSTFTDDDAGVELAATLSVAALSDLDPVGLHLLLHTSQHSLLVVSGSQLLNHWVK